MATLHGTHASLLWRLRRLPQAFAALERALRLDPAYFWAWMQLMAWSAGSEEPDRPVDTARALTRERPGDPAAWLALARVLEGLASASEKLGALKRVLTLEPHSLDAWDLKAELLARMGRFEEALATCATGTLELGRDACVLEGCGAWIEAERGNLALATARMREVLSRNVAYDWGWRMLAAWLCHQGEHVQAAEALERILRNSPNDAQVQMELGLVRLDQGESAAARVAFRAALDLDPEQVDAATNLFDLQLDAGNLSQAAETVERMRIHQPGGVTHLAMVLLELRRKQKAAALAAFESLCRQSDPSPRPLYSAYEALADANLSKPAIATLEAAAQTPGRNPEAWAASIDLLCKRNQHDQAVERFLALAAGEERSRAAEALVLGLAQQEHPEALRRLLDQDPEAFRSTDSAWANTGYALARFKPWEAVADWRERPGAQPWMLANLCLALERLGRGPQAREVARTVLERSPRQEGAEVLEQFWRPAQPPTQVPMSRPRWEPTPAPRTGLLPNLSSWLRGLILAGAALLFLLAFHFMGLLSTKLLWLGLIGAVLAAGLFGKEREGS